MIYVAFFTTSSDGNISERDYNNATKWDENFAFKNSDGDYEVYMREKDDYDLDNKEWKFDNDAVTIVSQEKHLSCKIQRPPSLNKYHWNSSTEAKDYTKLVIKMNDKAKQGDNRCILSLLSTDNSNSNSYTKFLSKNYYVNLFCDADKNITSFQAN